MPENAVGRHMPTECAYQLAPALPIARPEPNPQVTLTVKSVPTAKTCIVTVRGDVDYASARAFAETLDAARQLLNHLVVDLSNVRFFSAAGVNALLQAERTTVRLVCSPRVVRVIALCGLEGRWELHKSVFLALASTVSTEGHLDAMLAVGRRA